MSATQVEFEGVAAQEATDTAGSDASGARGASGRAAAKKAAPKAAPRQTGRRRAGSAARIRSEIELLAEISAKLDRVVAVVAAQGKDVDTQISLLAWAGCDSSFVGALVGMTAGAVRNRPGWRRAQEGAAAAASEEPA
jgi:hypothetical protein